MVQRANNCLNVLKMAKTFIFNAKTVNIQCKKCFSTQKGEILCQTMLKNENKTLENA